MASISSSSSSSLAYQSHPSRYDVFINFRGEDTRRSFSSHLYAALCRKGLLTFIDDDELKRGEEIAPSLLQAIQDSDAAVVVFSKDYASSTWCLDELAKIVECHQTRGQIVIPVFYDVNPSHIRKQSNDVATAFETHEQNPKNTQKIQKWRDALTRTANLSGLDSKDFRYDHMLISKIVEDISKKLKKSTVCDGDELLVGVDSHFKQIKKALAVEGQDVYIIGIWGMGGIGKTTIAEFVFKMLSSEFEGCCFLKNVREGSRVRDLKKELISQLLGEKASNVYAFRVTGLRPRKILIVLDDVDDSQQLDSLIGDPCWFGSRSVIIITGRDKQVLERRAEFLYEVESLNDVEALQLFSRSAFKQNYPRNDYVSLSLSIVEYAQGNPLALKVLGSSLSGKTTKEWESALNKFSKVPNKNIQVVLQSGYDGLDRMEQDIFLHIACFFKGAKKEVVMQVFESCEFDADIIISVLEDKCFVTISENTLEMHDLMQQMGKEIVRKESEYPNKRSRLWDPSDIYEVLVEDKGAEAVESIILDVSKITEIDLNPEVFMKTPNLKFLKFYVPNRYGCFEGKSNLRLSQGLDYLPNKLRYFHWHGYPLESFPLNFRPNNLIVLELPNSKIKQFQEEVKVENMGYLVAFQPTFEIFGTILRRFCSLIKIPSYIYGRQLGKVTSLSLVNCKTISHFPNGRVGFLEALEILNLEGCTNLNTFPEVSSNIKYLDLRKTAIKQIPSSSVEHLGKLKGLSMSNCCKLESLPSNFFHALTSLKMLDLVGCGHLKKLPDILENMYSLEELYLSGIGLEIPSSICNLKGLECLLIGNVGKLAYVPTSMGNLVSPVELFPEGPSDSASTSDPVEAHHHLVIDPHSLPLLLETASSLRIFALFDLKLRELPEDLSFLSSVTFLNLARNNFERIPASIRQLSNLMLLCISYCKRLISLPELPSSVIWLQADNCTSLEQIWAIKQLVLEVKDMEKGFCLWNCLKLDEDECHVVARHHLIALTRYKIQEPGASFSMNYPGSRIPEWVKYQSMGDSVEVPLPSHWLNRLFLGFAFYVCINSVTGHFPKKNSVTNYFKWDLRLKYDCYFGDNYHVASADICRVSNALEEHVVVVFNCGIFFELCGHGNSVWDVALFKFSLDKCRSLKILKCGVTPMYSQDQGELCQTFEFPTPVSTVKIEEADSN